MGRTVHRVDVIVNGTIADTFVLIDKGGNHATISNKGHILFDGYILEAYKIWENKLKEWKALEEFGFWKYEVIK